MNIKQYVVIVSIFTTFIFCIQTVHAKRVTQITGYKNNPVKQSRQYIEDIKLENDQQIHSALDFIKKYDIKHYNLLKKLQLKDFNRFVTKLEQWLNDNNKQKANYEKTNLYSSIKSLKKDAKILADRYKVEQDPDKQKKLKNELHNILKKIFENTLKIENLAIKSKKQEIAKLETKLYYKKKKKIILINSQLAEYLQ